MLANYSGFPLPVIRWLLDGKTIETEDPEEVNTNNFFTFSDRVNVSVSDGHDSINIRYLIDDDRGNEKIRKKVRTPNKWRASPSDDPFTISKHHLPNNVEEASNSSNSLDAASNLVETRGRLNMYGVRRSLLMTRVQCSARNSASLPASTVSATLDMNCELQILSWNEVWMSRKFQHIR